LFEPLSLREIGMRSAVDLFATYAGRGSDLAEWLRGAVINRDRNLRMLYLAGVALNLDDSAAIYADMLWLTDAFLRISSSAPKGEWTCYERPWKASNDDDSAQNRLRD
jgi:hypothetical protein